VQVDVDIGTFEEAMLVPIRLPDRETVTCRFEKRHIRRFVRGVSYYEQNVDNRLGREPGHAS